MESVKNEQRPIDMTPGKKKTTETKAQNLKYLRDKHREKVKGVFRFYECPGGKLEFFFREFKEDPVEKYSLEDGQVCDIPLGVAKHLNKNGWYPEHKHVVDENGKPIYKVGKKVRRYGFQSMEFVDVDELNMPDKELITVENV